MNVRKLSLFLLFMVMVIIPSMLFAHPAVQLLDENGVPITNNLNPSDNFTAANGSVYYKGEAFSPKQTCGKCHDYASVTKAYHFMTGAYEPDNSPDGSSNLSDDLWVSKNKDNNTLQKYPTHAYGHLESPGQFGCW
jgi:hypothetical protein